MFGTYKNAKLVLLIAISATGCASQNAMSLLPDAVKLDVARDKAASQGPISVDDMMAKAKALHPQKGGESEVATNQSQVDPVETASNKPAQPESDASQTAFAEVETVPPAKRQGKERDGAETDAVALMAMAAQSDQLETPLEDAGSNPADLFQQAMLLNKQSQEGEPAISTSVDDLKAAAAADEWQKLLAKQSAPQAEVAALEPETPDVPPLVMPITDNEIVAVNFDATGTALTKEAELKLKLLKFGKRLPQQIVIGKINGQDGFALMQAALRLGALVSDASGGEAAVSYDPTISAGAAELHYPAAGKQS